MAAGVCVPSAPEHWVLQVGRALGEVFRDDYIDKLGTSVSALHTHTEGHGRAHGSACFRAGTEDSEGCDLDSQQRL